MGNVPSPQEQSKHQHPLRNLPIFILFCFICGLPVYGVGDWYLERPNYGVLDLPKQGSRSNWNNELIVSYDRQGFDRPEKYRIWKNHDYFETSSASEITEKLENWFLDQGWAANENLYDNHFNTINYSVCVPQRNTLEGNSLCKLYYRPEFYSVACSPQAILYAEYDPNDGIVYVEVTTIEMVGFTGAWCD